MKDKIQKKLEEIKVNREKFVAQVNACNGAIQVLEQLLKEEENG